MSCPHTQPAVTSDPTLRALCGLVHPPSPVSTPRPHPSLPTAFLPPGPFQALTLRAPCLQRPLPTAPPQMTDSPPTWFRAISKAPVLEPIWGQNDLGSNL